MRRAIFSLELSFSFRCLNDRSTCKIRVAIANSYTCVNILSSIVRTDNLNPFFGIEKMHRKQRKCNGRGSYHYTIDAYLL